MGALTEAGRSVGQLGSAPLALRDNLQAKRKEEELKKVMEGVNLAVAENSPEGLLSSAQMLNKLGMTDQAVKLAEMAQKATVSQQNKVALASQQEVLAQRATALGLPEVAKNARTTTDPDKLQDIAKDLRERELKQLPSQSPAVRAQLAKAAGISQKQFKEMELGKADDETFNQIISGQEGDLEGWQDDKGNIKAYRVNNYGQVYDEESQSWTSPSKLGIQQAAPNVQKVIDVGGKMTEKLAEANVDNFVSLYEKADEAAKNINVINRQLERIGGMPTGIGANLELGLRKVGEALGMPYDPQVTNAENYIAEAATLVAQQIKDFGSGTGLSDADREYAKIGSGGDITVQAEALENLLRIRKRALTETVSIFRQTKASISKETGPAAVSSFTIAPIEESSGGTPPPPPGFRIN